MADTSFPDTALVAETKGGARSASESFRASLSGDMMVYLAVAAVVAAMWKISRMGLFEAGDDVAIG